ncbi:MAG: Signal peptide peptidase SppA, 36K type [archaeon GW2011_AR20]|nr:MAG: Signal peptide peptidase SppA, 36K type [archaeon GW2011_AR20]MBS3160664.1 signal peptide peptidase SppA [Candidatus Woesearchaeota archaeon]
MKKIIYIVGVLLFLVLISLAISSSLNNFEKVQEDEILIIPINGIISNSGGGNIFESVTVTSDKINSLIKKAEENKNIKAVIFEINSPGGTVLASKEIADAVKKLDKPKVALIRDVGASGAYWIASSADKIVADELSITGSIGVISSYLEFSELMGEYGIKYERLVSGEYKDAGSPYRELTSAERSLIQSKIDKIDQIFLSQVKESRNLTNTARIKTGEFFLGIEAKELGLVDYLGDKETAIEVAKELSNTKEAKLVEFKERKSIFDVLSKINAESFYYLGRGIGASLYFENKDNNLKINAI